jgi:hypothetical protein
MIRADKDGAHAHCLYVVLRLSLRPRMNTAKVLTCGLGIGARLPWP